MFFRIIHLCIHYNKITIVLEEEPHLLCKDNVLSSSMVDCEPEPGSGQT
jgi:hypothetical protein